MKALPACYDVAALRLTEFYKILPGHLERSLDRFRSAAYKIYMVQSLRRIRNKPVCQLFGSFGCEETCMGVGKFIELPMQSRKHIRMRMTKARYCGTTRSVDIAFAIGAEQFDALASDRHRHDCVCVAIKNMRHDGFLELFGLRWI